jgi:hypothetical protein
MSKPYRYPGMPDVLVGLTKAQAEFLVKICDLNIRMSAQLLPGASPEVAVKIVEVIDQFTAIKEAVRNGLDAQ